MIQIGRRYCRSDSWIGAHIHSNWFEITVVTGGKGRVTADDREIAVSQGDIFLSFPYETHAIYSEDELKYDFFSFFYEEGDYFGLFNEFTVDNKFVNDRVFKDERIAFLLDNAIAEMDGGDDPMTHDLLKAAFSQISIYILKDFNEQRRKTVPKTDSQILCYQIMNYIDTHLYSMKNVKEVSEHFKYNYSYLSVLFKRTAGISLSDYHRNKRMERAIVLMSGSKKIKEVAELLGYEDQFAFSKAFKKKYGISPKKANRAQGDKMA